MSPGQLGVLFACITALSWAALAIALKFSLSYSSPINIVWIRMLTAFILQGLLIFCFKQEQIKILAKPPLLALLAGLCMSANYFGFMKGIELTTASNSQIMIQLAPMSLILIGIFYFKEIPSPRQWLGICLALIGFSLFFGDQITNSIQNAAQFVDGNLWILFAAGTWALFATFQKILSHRVTPQQINLIIYITATIVLLPLADFSAMKNFTLGQWGFTLILGANTVISYGCLGEALKRIPASHVSLIVSVNPIITLILLMLMFYFKIDWIQPEKLGLWSYVAALLVVTGVATAIYKKSKNTSIKAASLMQNQ